MHNRIYSLAIVLASLSGPVCSAAERPNIVVILVDDMGFSDIGCYGSEIPTPHLDKLAANGLRFTQFYNTGRCCPTRATLLTGLYAHQAGIGHMTADLGHDGYRGVLNHRCITIGNVASSAGYLSTMTGKWHVGHRTKSNYPRARGFDRFYGIPEGGGFYFQVKKQRTIMLNDDTVASMKNPLPDGWYSTDAWVDEGLKFVDEAITAKKPFMWYLAHNAPHFPLQASAEDIAKFRGKYMDGWWRGSKKRHEKQIEMGLIDPNWKKAQKPGKIAQWRTLSTAEKERFDHMMAAYAACVHSMDRSIGTLVEGLKSRGQFNNTLILFMSDNGGCAESGPNGKSIGDPTTKNSDWFCGESWAWMQDTPFRKYKHYNHEGGIATPLIAHWPAGISAKGDWYKQPAHVIDIMATVTDLTGAKYPGEYKGHAILPMEGTSLRPAFTGQALKRDDAIYWEHEGNAAVRVGDWKLVRLKAKGDWELYDMKTDRTESNNLAAQNPDQAKRLSAKWQAWARRCNVKTDGLPKKKKKQNKKAASLQADGRHVTL
jgi:arylsulfatase